MENKIYLLIDNLSYYPQPGASDWIGFCRTEELGKAAMTRQREAGLAENLTLVAIDLDDLTWQEVTHESTV